MYLCYVDESGDPGEHGSRFLVLGASILFEGVWLQLRDSVECLLSSAFPPGQQPAKEMHMAALRKGSSGFSVLKPEERNRLTADFCNLANQFRADELVFVGVGADKSAWYAENPGKTGYDLYCDLFEQVISRFDFYLRRRHAGNRPSKGMVIVDPHSTNLSQSLKRQYAFVQRSGTQWTRTYNLIESALFLPSHESPGLQLADLCAYSVFRLLESRDDALARMVRDLFDREPQSALRNPGKWHGLKFLNLRANEQAFVRAVWPPP